MSHVDLTSLPAAEMELAYLEYRRACYHALHRHAEQRGLLKALHEPASLTELSKRMGFASSQRRTLELLLRALAQAGSVEVVDDDRQVYVASLLNDRLDRDRVVLAIGVDALESLVHGDSYPGIVDTLFDDDNRVAAAFIADNLPLWDEFLSMPFYRYNRWKAADTIASGSAAHVVDIACGPGFGLAELAQRVSEGSTVHGLEVSCDFAAEAIRRTSHLEDVVVSRCDVDGEGLRFLRDGTVDGAMMVGAFHFLVQPDRFLAQLRRAMAEGAPLCLSYVYMTRGSYDQALTDLRFHLREPAPHPRTEDELCGLLADGGFALESSYTMGCYQSFVFRAA